MNTKLDITQSFIIASIPFTGYFSAYFFLMGYFSYFQIPAYLITVTFETAVLSITLTTLLFMFLSASLYISFMDMPIQNSTALLIKTKYFFIGMLGSIIMFSLIAPYLILKKVLIPLGVEIVILSLVIAILLVISNLFYSSFKSKLDFIKKIIRDAKKDNEDGNHILNQLKKVNFTQIILTRVKRYPILSKVLFSLIFILLVILLSLLTGFTEAVHQKKFSVVKIKNDEYLVIQSNRESYIAVKYNRKQGRTMSQIKLLPKSEEISISLEVIENLNIRGKR